MRRRDFMKLSAGLGAAAAGLSPLSSARAQTISVFRVTQFWAGMVPLA